MSSFIRPFIILVLSFSISSTIFSQSISNGKSISLIRELSNIHGSPGYEDNVRDYLAKKWKRYLKNIEIDNIGNLYGAFNSSSNNTVLLIAHMDEVGFLVKSITEDGFIKIEPMGGGWVDQITLSHEWNIQSDCGNIIAISGLEPPHIIPGGFPKKLEKISVNNIFLDIGASSKKDVLEKFCIEVGQPITPRTNFKRLNNTSRFIGKAFDDRLALAAITEVMEELSRESLKIKLVFAATSQEEQGLKGAEVLAKKIHPKLVINIDIATANDHPKLATKSNHQYSALGAGVGIFAYDGSLIPNRRVFNFFKRYAQTNNIPFHITTGFLYAEDGSKFIPAKDNGTFVINLGIPVRYAHSHLSEFDLKDYIALKKYISSLITNLTPDILNGGFK